MTAKLCSILVFHGDNCESNDFNGFNLLNEMKDALVEASFRLFGVNSRNQFGSSNSIRTVF